mmetsp:Transcript_68200/g.154295  ORF Transcript_68200/g.154295 Transcript_68200/m.154295 type:complete len:219 (-) Transcript_68200:653-1309(-)
MMLRMGPASHTASSGSVIVKISCFRSTLPSSSLPAPSSGAALSDSAVLKVPTDTLLILWCRRFHLGTGTLATARLRRRFTCAPSRPSSVLAISGPSSGPSLPSPPSLPSWIGGPSSTPRSRSWKLVTPPSSNVVGAFGAPPPLASSQVGWACRPDSRFLSFSSSKAFLSGDKSRVEIRTWVTGRRVEVTRPRQAWLRIGARAAAGPTAQPRARAATST